MPPRIRRSILLRMVAGGLTLLCSLALSLNPASASEGSVDDLPQAVIDALEEVVPGIQFTEIEIEEEDDGNQYEIHGVWQQREVEAKLNEAGEILDLEIGDVDDGGEGALPSVIEDSLSELISGLSIGSFEFVEIGGLEFFEVQVSATGTPGVVRIAESGKLLSFETMGSVVPGEGTPISESELPLAVGAAIGGMVIERLTRFDTPEALFRIEGRRGNALVSMLVTEDGDLRWFELDRDADGIGDVAESDRGTHFDLWDTDADNYPDGFELLRLTDPLDAESIPQIVTVSSNDTEGVLEIDVQTFRGADFVLEQCGDAAGEWQVLGACFSGNGEAQEFVIPLIEEIRRCFFRIRILPQPDGGDTHPAGTDPVTGEDCILPESLVGSEIDIADDDDEESKSLCFKTGTRGEVIEHEEGEVEVTPFAYTFEIMGDCEACVTLTFSTSDGFETKIFTLTFTSESSGAYVSQEFENGEPEDPEEGDFQLTAN